ncbi:hypothetical protein DMN91_003766, partial [Ooceraea biroi]
FLLRRNKLVSHKADLKANARRKGDSTHSRFAMDRYEEEAEDSDNETDPEQLLNEWLGELDSLTVDFTRLNQDDIANMLCGTFKKKRRYAGDEYRLVRSNTMPRVVSGMRDTSMVPVRRTKSSRAAARPPLIKDLLHMLRRGRKRKGEENGMAALGAEEEERWNASWSEMERDNERRKEKVAVDTEEREQPWKLENTGWRGKRSNSGYNGE